MHGVTLKAVMIWLIDRYGWEELNRRISLKCFSNDPSLSSSLKFLRKTPWARQKVESLYIASQPKAENNIWLKSSKIEKPG